MPTTAPVVFRPSARRKKEKRYMKVYLRERQRAFSVCNGVLQGVRRESNLLTLA